MKKKNIYRIPHFTLFGLTLLLIVLLTSLTDGITQAAPVTVTADLSATADAGTIETIPTASAPNAYLVLNARPGGSYDHNFINFDLSVLPANATISSAELQLNIIAFGGAPMDVELGRVDATWNELTLNWNNQPNVTWNGPTATVSGVGDVNWTVTSLLQALQSSGNPFYGFALRGTNSTGAGVRADSKEWGVSPKLIVTYELSPPEGARPDLGDAPDSSNHLGVTNTAYLAGSVPGRFPTVWNVPAGQPAGPRHDNETGEGILGDYLSKEVEADQGQDEDGDNNILDGGADNANNDRGDDGWRNRDIKFFDCQQQTLTIRITRANNPTLNRMYLNVWFDGNRDGDWADIAPCTDPSGGPAQASYEWLVQDHIVDMTAIPAGGYLDIQVNTELIHNITPNQAHWMRFTLSEERAEQSTSSDFPDGRGPHPDSALGSYRFGETEDVLQKPPPAGEDGELLLEKRVLTNNDPVSYAGSVTYEIRLRHDGGSQPIQAEIRDELPYPLHLNRQIDNQGNIFLVDVTSPTGGASPLEAGLDYEIDNNGFVYQVVSWEGSLEPNAEIRLSFEVHVHPVCGANEQTVTIANVAQARPLNGNQITAEETFEAACPGYNPASIRFELDDSLQNPLDLNGFGQFALKGEITNNHPYTLPLAIMPMLTGNYPVNLPAAERITLGPGESRSIDFPIDLDQTGTDELSLPDDITLEGKLVACFVVDGPYTFTEQNPVCPDEQQYPHLFVKSESLDIQVRPYDLGDAPDSSNHFGVPMSAYAGQPATFPTVFDPATGLPPGPAHAHPGPFHLGPNVSREAEADIGPDQDPVNNIQPPANTPNTDGFDDGANPNTWILNNCQTTTVPVQVMISPQAVNWFQQQENKDAYLNVWLDGNRDGDWEDGMNCPQNQNMVEHIIIDFPVDVTALGAGLHVINVPTGRVPWPAALAQQPTWVRVTLSERESNKTLQFGGINYGDGRGYNVPFKTGETEDYFAYPQGAAGGGPDLAVWLNGEAQQGNANGDRVRFKIDYANLGSRPANGGLLTFEIPTALHGIDIHMLQAPGIPANGIQQSNGELNIQLPAMDAGQKEPIIITWQTDLPASPLSARVGVVVSDDLDTTNNEATLTLNPTLAAPLLGLQLNHGAGWGTAETTCRPQINLGGKGIPGEQITVLLDGQPADSITINNIGVYTATLTSLADGQHLIEAVYDGMNPGSGAMVRLRVDSSLPVDPLSLTFTDSQGRTLHPPTWNWSSEIGAIGQLLRPGEVYEVEIDSCSDALNQKLSWRPEIEDEVIASAMRDDDGNGRYSGTLRYNPSNTTTSTHSSLKQSSLHQLAANTGGNMNLTVITGGVAQQFGFNVQPFVSGVVRDAFTGLPVDNAEVSALSGSPSSALWPTAALGTANPQMTGSDGSYSFNTPANDNRVEINRTNYQPYRSTDITALTGLFSLDVALTPGINQAADYTIIVSANGFDPAVLTVPAGSVISWVNADLAEHGAAGAGWDSGLLDAGASYQTKIDAPGSYLYADPANDLNTATIIVEGDYQIFLPVVLR